MLQKEDLHEYCLAKNGVVKEEPFGDNIFVYKVGGKMFALMPFGANDPQTITLKCEPMLATVLRQTYPAVTGAYHFNKTHWNGVVLDGSVPDDEICEWVDHSYDLIVKSLPKKIRDALINAKE